MKKQNIISLILGLLIMSFSVSAFSFSDLFATNTLLDYGSDEQSVRDSCEDYADDSEYTDCHIDYTVGWHYMCNCDSVDYNDFEGDDDSSNIDDSSNNYYEDDEEDTYETCSEKTLSSGICKSNDLYKKVQERDCDIDYQKIKNCEYGCSDSQCFEDQASDYEITDLSVSKHNVRPNQFIYYDLTLKNKGGLDNSEKHLECGIYPSDMKSVLSGITISEINNVISGQDEYVKTYHIDSTKAKSQITKRVAIQMPTLTDFQSFTNVAQYVDENTEDFFLQCGVYDPEGQRGDGYITYDRVNLNYESNPKSYDDEDTINDTQETQFTTEDFEINFSMNMENIHLVGEGQINFLHDYEDVEYMIIIKQHELSDTMSTLTNQNICDEALFSTKVTPDQLNEFDFKVPLESGNKQLDFFITDNCQMNKIFYTSSFTYQLDNSAGGNTGLDEQSNIGYYLAGLLGAVAFYLGKKGGLY